MKKSARRWGTRSIASFELLEQVGQGTFGRVYRARDLDTGELVAMKEIMMEKEREGFPITATREIKILRTLKHVNVVRLKEIVTNAVNGRGDRHSVVYMVFEYMEYDLTGLMEHPLGISLTQMEIKCFMQQLLRGLEYCHATHIMHRDIKGSNMLINRDGYLKLGDFGLARPYSTQTKSAKYTNRVITLWYRPPEILLGERSYTDKVDIWSAGCLLGELMTGRPILAGDNPVQQLDHIFHLCGTPTFDENGTGVRSWPDVIELEYWKDLEPAVEHSCKIRTVFKGWQPEALDLISKMLHLDPKKRITASQALKHDFFFTAPLPLTVDQLQLTHPECHEWETKRKREDLRNAKAQARKAVKLAKGADSSTTAAASAAAKAGSRMYDPTKPTGSSSSQGIVHGNQAQPRHSASDTRRTSGGGGGGGGGGVSGGSSLDRARHYAERMQRSYAQQPARPAGQAFRGSSQEPLSRQGFAAAYSGPNSTGAHRGGGGGGGQGYYRSGGSSSAVSSTYGHHKQVHDMRARDGGGQRRYNGEGGGRGGDDRGRGYDRHHGYSRGGSGHQR